MSAINGPFMNGTTSFLAIGPRCGSVNSKVPTNNPRPIWKKNFVLARIPLDFFSLTFAQSSRKPTPPSQIKVARHISTS